MSEHVEITIKGRKGFTDGYAEFVLGALTIGGILESYGMQGDDDGKHEFVLLKLQLKDMPLGHLGLGDLRPVASPKEKAWSSARDFQEMVRHEHYLILDTETTGLEQGEICQICVLDDAGRVLMYEFVKPVHKIPLEATKIHGISNDMVKEARGWAEIALDLEPLLKGQNVVVYNATYDRKMMHQSAEAAHLPAIAWKQIARFWCAMETYAVIAGEWNDYRGNYRWQKLSAAAQHFGIRGDWMEHDAQGDCKTTLAVCKAIAQMQDIKIPL